MISVYGERFSVTAWNSMIRQALNNGDPWKALFFFRQMKQQQPHAQSNKVTFIFVAKACAKLTDSVFPGIVHSSVVKTPHYSDMYVQTALIDMYVKCNRLNCAYLVFEEMLSRDVASWNVMFAGFVQMGFSTRASAFFNTMRFQGIMPDAVSIMGLTQLVVGMDDLKALGAVNCFGYKCGFLADTSVANTLISGYAKCGDLHSAERIFCGIDLAFLNVVSWNVMIAGFASCEQPVMATRFYKQMLNNGYSPDLCTILNLLSSFAQSNYLCWGMSVHAHGLKLGCDTDIAMLNTLISMYSKCGGIKSAKHVFDRMSSRSCVTWTAMIGGYSEIGDIDQAFMLFDDMVAAGEKPDLVTVVYLISACGKVGALELGKWMDDYTFSQGLKNHVMVCNALMDMYAKCGSIDDAETLFDSMSTKNVVSWTTLISGFALNGKFEAALNHYNWMLNLGLKPNHITLLAVLQACTHAGFLDKGREIFDTMTEVHKINPGLDHYACISQLLARKGMLKEALQFIQEMPMKPDAGIWSYLLSACKIHRNIDVAEYAASVLFELDPQAAAPYVEMANIYASAKDWNGVAAMRMTMKCTQVSKSQGCSVIQVDGMCKSFAAGDRLHPQGSQVFEILDGLVLQLKEDTEFTSVNS